MLGKGTPAAATAATAEGGGTGPSPDRRARRREATKAEILDAAWALARADGLTTFSMRDVATRVGMQAPSLYQYFDSKHAIYDAMFGQAAQQALEEVCADLPTGIDTTDSREVTIVISRRVFDFATSDPARMQLLFQRTIPGFEPSPAAYAPSVEMSVAIQTVLVDLGFTDPDAMDLWTAVVSGLINQQMSNDPGGTRWASLLERTVDMYIAQMDAGPRSGTRSATRSGTRSGTRGSARRSKGSTRSTDKLGSTRTTARTEATTTKRGR
jgi:AcrR family transcriptional regulator